MSVVSMRRTDRPVSSSAELRITARMRAKVSLSVAFVKMSARQNLVPTWWQRGGKSGMGSIDDWRIEVATDWIDYKHTRVFGAATSEYLLRRNALPNASPTREHVCTVLHGVLDVNHPRTANVGSVSVGV